MPSKTHSWYTDDGLIVCKIADCDAAVTSGTSGEQYCDFHIAVREAKKSAQAIVTALYSPLPENLEEANRQVAKAFFEMPYNEIYVGFLVNGLNEERRLELGVKLLNEHLKKNPGAQLLIGESRKLSIRNPDE